MHTPSRHAVPAASMAVIGGIFVVLGGLIAAVTGPLTLEHGSWLAAYLVLVCGVAQLGMGTVQAGQTSSAGAVSPRLGWVQLASLNLGNAAVVAGTLTRVPLVVDGGVVLLVVAFGLALYTVRPWRSTSGEAVAGISTASTVGRFLLWTYRVFLVLLVVSLPIGSILAHLRAP